MYADAYEHTIKCSLGAERASSCHVKDQKLFPRAKAQSTKKNW